MTVNYTTLLGLAQPVPGTEVGTWGTTINDSLTALIESATAGTTSKDVTAAGDWTLTTTGSGAANEQRMAIIRPFGTPGASRNIIAPAQSKIYVVVNASNGAVVFKSSTSTGVTIPAGKTTIIAWNSAASSPDFAEISPSTATNLASGSAGTVPYQSGVGATAMLAAGTSGQILTSGGAGAPTWSNGATLSSQLNLTNASNYNLYASGAGGNYMASNLGIGGFAGNIGGFTGYVTLNVSTNMGGSTNANGIWQNGIIQSSVTNAGYGVRNSLSTAAATFTLPVYYHYYASQSTIGAGSTVTTQYGFYAANSLTGASVNVGFYGGINAGSGRYNLQMVGTADNLLNGPLSIGTGNPANASSLLDVQSTTKGVRFPNMTTTQKNAIATPAAGLMVFDTTLSKLCVYSGSAWETVSST